MFCQPGGRVVDALNVIYEKTHKIRKKLLLLKTWERELIIILKTCKMQMEIILKTCEIGIALSLNS